MDEFWATVAEQLRELRSANSAEAVAAILSAQRNPYKHERIVAQGFFAGSGGDDTVEDQLRIAGWRLIWTDAHYYYAMQAPDGSAITYVEGDIYTRDLRAVSTQERA